MKVKNNNEEFVQRSFIFNDFETKDNEEYNIEGHAAIFNSRTNIAQLFDEIIEPGAFDGCDLSDVSLFVNHRQDELPLARCKNGQGTMSIGVDSKGLYIRAKLDIENNQAAQSLYSAIRRKDVNGMSFSFRVKEQKWENMDSDMPLRRIQKISKVSEVSAVTYPAYEATDIDSRSKKDYDDALEEHRETYSDLELERLRAITLLNL